PSYSSYVLCQSMMFDANPGTEAHQDCFYIDSEPRGALVGLWLALEDIDERAGRFWVAKGSHRLTLAFEGLSNAAYLQSIEARLPNMNIVTPEVRKGDAILWHVNCVHGAHDAIDPAFSRKSITAHYVPGVRSARGNARIFTNQIVRTAVGMPYY